MRRSVVIFLAFLSGAVGNAAERGERTSLGDDPPALTAEQIAEWFRLRERPSDPYIPRVRDRRGDGLQPKVPALAEQLPSRSRWVRGPFVSIQVNVDSEGNNIVGDAANEPSIAVNPVHPRRMAIGWRQFDTVVSNFRQAGWANTGNGGQTWNFRGVLNRGEFSSDPVLDVDLEGNFYYYSLQPDRGPGPWACYLYKSIDSGVSWNLDHYSFGGDKAWMAVDRTGGVGTGHIYTLWSPFAGCCSAGLFSRSTNGGRTFETPRPVPDDPFAGTLTVARDGTVYGAGATGFFTGLVPVVRSTNAQFVDETPSFELVARVDLGGFTMFGTGPNPGGLLGQMWIAADTSTGPHGGNLYLCGSVNPPGGDPLDVMFSRSTNGGLTWSEPIRVNNDPFEVGAWQWFGTMSVAPNGRIDVIWNHTSSSPGPSISELYHARSFDGGQSFTLHRPVSIPFDHSLGYPNQNKLGDYYDMVSDNGGVNIAYAATFNNEQDVYFLRIDVSVERCTLAGTTAGVLDCNLNGVSDECDIERGTSLDEDGNRVPDECERDFDGDGLTDAEDPDIDNDGVVNLADVCDFTPLGARIHPDGRQFGDADFDCTVGLSDFALLRICFPDGGPDVPAPFRFCTEQFDYDGDENTDLEDFAGFQSAFTGNDSQQR